MVSAKAKASPDAPYTYILDDEDRIIALSDNWSTFARENGAPESCRPDLIINKPIWNFVCGDDVVELYRLIFGRVRAQNKSVKLTYRCDSPDLRRYLELHIKPLQLRNILLSNHLLHEEPHEPARVLDIEAPRSDETIKMCSICKKVEVTETSWVEVEDAAARLKLFEKEKMPQISHGLCSDCLKLCMIEIEKINL